MPTDCPNCCRALEEIERMVFQIEEITSKYLSSGEQREVVEKVVKRIVNVSREARDAECREG
jgi:hypothetical protein